MLSDAEWRSTVPHEAAHAVGCIWAGHPIEEIRIGDWDEDVCGNVRLDLSDGWRPDIGYVTAVAMGPLAVGKSPPTFEELTLKSEGDAFQLACASRLLKLDQADYDAAIATARDLLDTPAFKDAHALLSAALICVPVVTGDQVDVLLGPLLDPLQSEGASDAA